MESDVHVEGSFKSKFGLVREAFAQNFQSGRELGACVAVMIDGEMVVDLWGGYKDKARTQYWEEDTIVSVQSVVKGFVALCGCLLIDRGDLDPARPVAYYWPEFARAGKENITVYQLLTHQSGVIYTDHVPKGAAFEWHAVANGLAEQEPAWEPGTRGGFHSSTYGHLVGELVRRVSGDPVSVFFKKEFADPLGLDFRFVLNRDEQALMAEYVTHQDSMLTLMRDPSTPLGRAWQFLDKPLDFNSPRVLETEMIHGCGHARDMAILFGQLARGGEMNGFRLLSEQMVKMLSHEAWRDICGLMDVELRMSMGLLLNHNTFGPMGPNPDAYGYFGAGGTATFADPELKLGFGYAMNAMYPGMGVSPLYLNLMEAVYACL